jgi:transposase
MRFVPVKSAEQQAALTMLGVRDLLVKQRTMLINAIRGHAAEFGITVAKSLPSRKRAKAGGLKQVPELLGRLASEEGVPSLAREMIAMLSSQLDGLDIKLTATERRLMAWHRPDQTSQCLATIPGIGPITAVSFALKVPDAKAFRSRRHFAPWLGIPSREGSPAGRQKLGKISRAGDEDLRRLLVIGATAVIRAAKPGQAAPRRGCWPCWRASRRSWWRSRWPNKIARIVRAMMVSSETYRQPAQA